MEKLVVQEITSNRDRSVAKFQVISQPSNIKRGCKLVWRDNETGIDIFSVFRPCFFEEEGFKCLAKASFCIRGTDKSSDDKVFDVPILLVSDFCKTIDNFNNYLDKQQEKSQMSENEKCQEKTKPIGTVNQTIVFHSEDIQKIITKYVQENYCPDIKFYSLEVVSSNDVVATVHV